MIKKVLTTVLGKDFMRLQFHEKVVWLWIVLSFCLVMILDYDRTPFVTCFCVILNFGASVLIGRKVLPEDFGKDNEL